MKKIAAMLALLGIALLGYSLVLKPYKDEQTFMKQYYAMNSGQSAEYYTLRESQLTAKYTLQDFGIEALLFSVLLLVCTSKGRIQINAFRSRTIAFSAALALPILFVVGYVFDLIQAADRGEFPHWADSMGIPLMGVPVILIFLWFWAFCNIGLAQGVHKPSRAIREAFNWRKNWWQLTNAGLWLLLAANAAAFGQYWYTLPALAWLYFFLAIGASRSKSISG